MIGVFVDKTLLIDAKIPSVVVYCFQKQNKKVIGMEKHIPYEKVSRMEKRKIDQVPRQTWTKGKPSPVGRKTARIITERGRRIGRKTSGTASFLLSAVLLRAIINSSLFIGRYNR